MNCLHCHTPNEEGAKFCKNCGMALSYTPAPATGIKNDILILVAYIGWHFLTYLVYTFINKVVIPKLIAKGPASGIGDFYRTLDRAVSGIDIAFLLIIILVLKNTVATVFCIVFLAIRVGLLILYQFN
jgi:hypothetical protein